MRTVVALGVRSDRVIRVASVDQDEIAEIALDDLEPDALHGWAQYPLGTAWALGQVGADLQAVPGLDLYVDSDVPVGVGMGSSVALCAAVAIALNDAWRVGADPATLAKVCNTAESLSASEDVGLGPALAALTGAADHAVLLDGRSKDYECVPLALSSADFCLIIIHTSGQPVSFPALGARLEGIEAVLDALGATSLREVTTEAIAGVGESGDVERVDIRLAHHIVRENARVLDAVRSFREEGPEAIGQILTDSHYSLTDVFGRQSLEVELAVHTALENGAVGAKLIGHRMSSSVVALAPHDVASRISQALDSAFSEHGFEAPDVYIASPSDKATRH